MDKVYLIPAIIGGVVAVAGVVAFVIFRNKQ